MVPEVLEEVTGLEDSPFKEHPISYAMMLICLGYFIISLTEDVGDHHHGPSKDRDETTIDPPIAMSEWSSGDGANPSSNQRRETEETVQESPDSEPNTSPLISIPIHSPGDSDNLSPSQHHATDDNVSETPNLARNLGMKAFRLVLGISIHEFFEGFAVGYAPDAASTW